MIDWKRIDKEPPPKDGRDILLCDARIDSAVVAARWEGPPDVDGFCWSTLDGKYHTDAWTHWAEIGPQPTMEPGHEPCPAKYAYSECVKEHATRAAERMRERAAVLLDLDADDQSTSADEWHQKMARKLRRLAAAIRALPTDGE